MKVLVDTSIWVDHLRRRDAALVTRLTAGEVNCHPFVIGELACGNLQSRAQVLGLLTRLIQLPVSSHDEVLHLVDQRKLMGRGLGWIDAHLLCAALLNGSKLWTRDRALAKAATELGIAL